MLFSNYFTAVYNFPIIIMDESKSIAGQGPVSQMCQKLFGWHKSLCIFDKNKFQTLKLGSYFAFPYIRNLLKEELFTASGSQIQ